MFLYVSTFLFIKLGTKETFGSTWFPFAFAKASIGEQPKESTYGAFAAVVKRHGIGGLFHGLPTRSVLHAVVWCVVGAGREFCEWAGLRETCFIMAMCINICSKHAVLHKEVN